MEYHFTLKIWLRAQVFTKIDSILNCDTIHLITKEGSMNQIFKSSLVLAATLPLSALANPQYKNGFYMGLDLGGTQYQSQFSESLHANYGDEYGDPQLVGMKNSDLNDVVTGFDANIKVGYGLFMKSLFLGVELAANWNNVSDSLSSLTQTVAVGSYVDTYNTTLSSDAHVKYNAFEPTLDFKPGVRMGRNSLLYARFGASYNQVKLTESAHFDEEIYPSFTYSSVQNIHLSETKNVVGFRVGVGMEQKFNRHFAVNVDYIHTDYGNLEVKGAADIATVDGSIVNGFTVEQQADLTRDTVTLGMSYYF